MNIVCSFCASMVPVARFPWLYQRHDIHGRREGGATICAGSRNVFTLDLLGLRELEPEYVPPPRGAV